MSARARDVHVFLGPTLRREAAAGALDATFLPPAAQGDVYRVARLGPAAIGIVDGYFSGAPSVWHKEILYALHQGIPVFGSASMGALRAAELHGFGMRGVGRIFEDFRDGVLEDDDEVAVEHGPAETGYVALSEPMVNIRATLAQAERTGVLTPDARRAVDDQAKALFFPRRDWATILAAAPIAPAERTRLEAFLAQGRVDQKRADALAMLAAIRDTLAAPMPAPASFDFEWTHFFDALVTRSERAARRNGLDVVEELRLEGGDAYQHMRMRAQLRLLAGQAARRAGHAASIEERRAALTRMRDALGLYTRAALEAWLERNHLDAAALEALITDLATQEHVLGRPDAALEQAIADELRLGGRYEDLAARAAQKRRRLGLATDAQPTGPDTAALRLWFFEQHRKQPLPDPLQPFVRALGFTDVTEFDSAVRREWVYLHMIERGT